MPGGPRVFVLLLFFVSGACALAYEVVWTRTLTHVFGTTAIAVGTVLAAYMAGLALGGRVLGPLADRHPNPLRLYALCELGVGLAAWIAHFTLTRIAGVYVALHDLVGASSLGLAIARFVLAFTIMLVPTFLMGATLPILARFVVTRRERVGASLGSLYAVNTVGAVAGVVLTGFWSIGVYGLDRTVYFAVAANLLIAGVAFAVARRVPGESAESGAPRSGKRVAAPALTPGVERLLLLALGTAGLASFAYEIFWTRALVFVVGNSTYAVSGMLTAFLGGLALGGFLARFAVDRVRNGVAWFGGLQIAIAVTSAAALPLLFAVADPVALREALGRLTAAPGLLLGSRFAVALAVMLVPATLIGATFPLVGKIAVRDTSATGKIVGRLYAINTLGNVLGALLPGLVLLSWLGIQRGILAMAALNAAAGLTLLFAGRERVPWRWGAVVLIVVAAFAIVPGALDFRFPAENQGAHERELYYREGPSATTQVLRDPDTRRLSMAVDGIEIGGTGFTDFKQQLLAHLPKLLVNTFAAELSVGLGSAILAGESALHPELRRITCVEIEPGVVEGAAFFARPSHRVFDDPRLDVVLDDIANHLRTVDARYDVISADEKTAKEYASNGFSYSREYYALLLTRLAPGGVVAQWVPADLPPGAYAMVLRTFAVSFPHVQLWHFLPASQNGPANTILVGSNAPLLFDGERLARLGRGATGPFAGIARYGLDRAEALLPHYVADGDAIREAVWDAPENTVDRPRYEFFSPRDYAMPSSERLAKNFELLTRMRPRGRMERRQALRGEAGERLQQALDAEERYLAGYRAQLAGAPEAQVFREFEAALDVAPGNESLRRRIFLHYWNATSRRVLANDGRGAEHTMRRATELWGGSAHARTEYAILRYTAGALDDAVRQAEIAVTLDPRFVLGRRVLAQAFLATGRRAEAAEQERAIHEIEREDD